MLKRDLLDVIDAKLMLIPIWFSQMEVLRQLVIFVLISMMSLSIINHN